ncbi:MAG: dihydroorotase [Saprospiraceae bacterium]|nr:dihydroorotase [Saprospiraceae bacterium]NNL90805.1 dihydroorotase [Saprospiraceae bacterium]
MSKKILRNAKLINRGQIKEVEILVNDDRIEQIDSQISVDNAEEYDCNGKWVIPGIIDDQVHFREPGLTHKANIATESAAAAAGGVTSFMEMPNTKPPATSQEALESKYQIAKNTSTVNYSFFMGASNDNIEEVLKTNEQNVCGVKIFMGSSTGNMLVDNEKTLNELFSKVPMLIATHCEDEATIRKNLAKAKEKYGENVPVEMHPIIRNTEGCYISSHMATEMAKKYGTRLHILHISTEKEIALFNNDIPLKDKKITSEVCVHHLFFDESYYYPLGNKVKCNPAIKSVKDREALLEGLKNGYFDVIATDHAPHTMEEKSQNYLKAPSGLPLVQHSLTLMMDFYHKGLLPIEFIIEKMCHAPADLFRIKDRGYADEGKFADLVVVDSNMDWQIQKSNIEYKCGWSPLEGFDMKGKVESTLCNGNWVYKDHTLTKQLSGSRLLFDYQ